jgi:hypothetical protein
MKALVLSALIAQTFCVTAEAATSRNVDPVGSNNLQLRGLPASSADCITWRTSVRESAAGVALLSAVLPKAIDAGVDALAAALHKASGEDDKTAISEGVMAATVYDYDVKTKIRSWSTSLACLEASTPNNDFVAGFVIEQSPDESAISFKLARLTYKKQLKEGRDLAGMTMAIILKGVDGSEIGNGIVAGPFVLSDSQYVADSKKRAVITTPWMPFPTPSETVKGIFTAYEDLCAVREEAIRAYIDTEKAKVKAPSKPDPKLKLTYDPNRGLCGNLVLLDGMSGSTKWTPDRESTLGKLENSLARHGPVTIRLVVTETRDVNKFLLKVSDFLAGSKEDIKTALVNDLDPTKKVAARKVADGLKEDYDIALAKFEEKVRLYEIAVAAAKKAQEALTTAQSKSDEEALARAQTALEQALTTRAAAFEEALTARKVARSAAIDADISIGTESKLATFPG